MELQTCSSVCGLCIDYGREEQQEEFTRLQMQKIKKVKEDERERKVYSFRLEQCRRLEDSDKNVAWRSNQIMRRIEDVNAGQRCNSPVETARFYSPQIRMQKRVGMPLKIQQKRVQSYGLKSLLSPRAMLQPKINFHFNPPQAQPSKMTGKRIRTIEEQTQYSSKHSQILFKTAFQIPENASSFPRPKGQFNHIIFQQPTESSKHISQSNSLHTISQCKLSQEQSHPAHIQQYNNGTTFQSIVTSTEIKSRNSSRLQNQFKWLRDPREIRPHNTQSNHVPQSHQMHRYSNFQETNKIYLSPREQQPQRMQVDPNMFYQSCRRNVSPRVSVLSFSKHQEPQQNDLQQQLRDVIDHNFLISQACSKTNSPKVSINPSLKNISQNSSKKSPFHSRDNSWQLGPLMSTRAKMKRTNTIESIQSFSSEMISCLDIKFMQKNKGRRGVSRLV